MKLEYGAGGFLDEFLEFFPFVSWDQLAFHSEAASLASIV